MAVLWDFCLLFYIIEVGRVFDNFSCPQKKKNAFCIIKTGLCIDWFYNNTCLYFHSYSWISIKWKRRQNQCTIFLKRTCTWCSDGIDSQKFYPIMVYIFSGVEFIKKHFIPMTEISLRRLVSAMLLIHLSEPKQRLHVYVSWKTRTSASVIFVLADNGFFTQKALAR